MEVTKATCETHGEYDVYPIEIMGRVIAHTQCPECTRLYEEREELERQERIRRYQEQKWLEAGVAPEYFGKTLDDYRPENESERKALEAAWQMRRGELKKLLILGSNGTGKTLLGDALVMIKGGVRITAYELSARIRAGYNSGESELDILNQLLEYPFIFIDEVGRTKGSEAEKNWFSYLIDKAHTFGKDLMLVSNRQLARSLPADRKGEAFEFYFDNDVISRLRQDSKIIEVQGRDRRRESQI